MSDTVRILREVEVSVDVRVYEVRCSEPGHGGLNFDVVADRDGDLIVTAEPCPACQGAAARAGE